MKKQILLSAFFALLALMVVKPEKSSAQITGINPLYFSPDSMGGSTCAVPGTWGFEVLGYLTGTVPADDSVTIYVNFGDGIDSTFKAPANSFTGEFYAGMYHNFTMVGTFTPYVVVTTSASPTVYTASISSNTSLVYTNNCATISGYVYADNNTNCIHDAGDESLGYTILTIVNTSVTPNDVNYVCTDQSGYYAIDLPVGANVTITPTYNPWWYASLTGINFAGLIPTCPTSGTAALTVAAATVQDFGFNCIAPLVTDSIDLYTAGYGMHFKPSDTGYIQISGGDYAWSYSCNGIDATMTLVLDNHLTYVTTLVGVPPTTVSGQTLTWNFSGIVSWYNSWADIQVVCDGSAVIGDTLCNQASISGTLFDPYLANNTFNICHYVSNSWDPNEKQVVPHVDAVGTIANGTPLMYFIEFQNTGNATANNVTVVDKIDPDLDITSVKLLKSSFAGVQLYIQGDELKFRFNNINLPDSGSNPAGSIGYVSYMAVPKPNLASGTHITNSASIYFDYNPAIVTDTTLNTIEVPTGVQRLVNGSMKATVSPNPANDQVSVKTNDKSEFAVTMTDMLGRIVAAEQSANGVKNINTHSLPSGLYLVNVKGAKGGDLTTKVTVQH